MQRCHCSALSWKLSAVVVCMLHVLSPGSVDFNVYNLYA